MKTLKDILGTEEANRQLTRFLETGHKRLTGDYAHSCFGVAISPQSIKLLGDEDKLTEELNQIRDIELPQWHDACNGWVSCKSARVSPGSPSSKVLRCSVCYDVYEDLMNKISNFIYRTNINPIIVWDKGYPKIEHPNKPKEKNKETEYVKPVVRLTPKETLDDKYGYYSYSTSNNDIISGWNTI